VREHVVPLSTGVVAQSLAAGSDGLQTPTSHCVLRKEQSFVAAEQLPVVQVPAGVQLLPPHAEPSVTF
jgi:hypothetical protein